MNVAERNVLASGFRFPESPRWKDGLWFTDMLAKTLIVLESGGKVREVSRFDDQPGGCGFFGDSCLIALRRSMELVSVEESRTRHHADLSGLGSDHLSDMVVCPDGRAYVSVRAAPPVFAATSVLQHANDSIVLVDPDGAYRVVAENLVTPNGMAIAQDGRRLVVAETRARRLSVFNVSADGSLSARRLFADLADYRPDGICLDESGAVWLASPDPGCFVRVAEGGKVLDTLSVPTGVFAVACVLGGDDRRTLFLLSAKTSYVDFVAGRAEGMVESARVKIPGAGLP